MKYKGENKRVKSDDDIEDDDDEDDGVKKRIRMSPNNTIVDGTIVGMSQTVKTSSPFLLHKQQVPDISDRGSELIDSNGGIFNYDSNFKKSAQNNDSNSQVTQIVNLFNKKSDSNGLPDSNGEFTNSVANTLNMTPNLTQNELVIEPKSDSNGDSNSGVPLLDSLVEAPENLVLPGTGLGLNRELSRSVTNVDHVPNNNCKVNDDRVEMMKNVDERVDYDEKLVNTDEKSTSMVDLLKSDDNPKNLTGFENDMQRHLQTVFESRRINTCKPQVSSYYSNNKSDIRLKQSQVKSVTQVMGSHNNVSSKLTDSQGTLKNKPENRPIIGSGQNLLKSHKSDTRNSAKMQANEKGIVKRMKVKWSPKPKSKVSPKIKVIGGKSEEKSTPSKMSKKNNDTKVKLIIKEFEKNIEVGDAYANKNVTPTKNSKYRDAFKILMESSSKFGGGTKPSPGSIRKRKKRNN